MLKSLAEIKISARHINRMTSDVGSNLREQQQQRAALHAKAKLKIGTLMESLIKEVSDRVQGTAKFWNNPEGANQILAVKAAALSDDGRLLEAC